MNKQFITRRTVVAAGFAVGAAALIPISGIWVYIPKEDLQPIGPNPTDNHPYNSTVVGSLDPESINSFNQFANWVIACWEFPDMESYTSLLAGILAIKTNQQPSYLSEYQNAAELIKKSVTRLGSPESAFIYLLFSDRKQKNPLKSKLGRAQHFVFDELVRHIVISGGYRKFGLQNYNGAMHLPIADPNSYRRII